MLREVEALRTRGYTYVEVANKTGLSPEYVTGISFLLANGENRLLRAVEKGIVPHSIATEIAVPSAAEMLCADGAAKGGQSLYSAIFAYNHADWYVDEVLAIAREYAQTES